MSTGPLALVRRAASERREGGDRRRPPLLFELLLVAVGYALYAHVRNLQGHDGGESSKNVAYRHGRDVMDVERTIHVDPEHVLQSWVIHNHAVLHGMAVFYLTAHVLVTVGTLVFLYVRRPAIYRKWRNILLVVTFAAVGLFALYPTAPPRLLPGSGLHDTLAMTGGLWSYNGGALERIADPYAAMPSLHLGWATWVAVSLAAAFRPSWPARRCALFFVYPVVVTFNVLASGTHWFLDTIAGSALLLVVWGGYAVAERLWRAHRLEVASSAVISLPETDVLRVAPAVATDPADR